MRLFVFCFILACVGCSPNKGVPKGILSPEKMQVVVFDLLRADEFIANYKSKDSTLNRTRETLKIYEQVFSIHKVTRQEFYRSYKYYQEHPDVNKNMFDSLFNRLNKQKDTSVNLKPKQIS